MRASTDGGYDDGYKASGSFWGMRPGRLVRRLGEHLNSFNGLHVLDAGCGEGKNAFWLSNQGATVLAVDVSKFALRNAASRWTPQCGVTFLEADFANVELEAQAFDITIAYGLLHCFPTREHITAACRKLRSVTKPGGYILICTFNDRRCGHIKAHPNLDPCLLPHDFYLLQFSDGKLLYESDEDLTETHPNNNVLHTHSMTRLLVEKTSSNAASRASWRGLT